MAVFHWPPSGAYHWLPHKRGETEATMLPCPAADRLGCIETLSVFDTRLDFNLARPVKEAWSNMKELRGSFAAGSHF